MARRHRQTLHVPTVPLAVSPVPSPPPSCPPPRALVAIHAGAIYPPGDVIPEAIAAQLTLGREYTR